jgi:hypothetical protein
MNILTCQIKNQAAYETHFPKVKVVHHKNNYFVIREDVDIKDYAENYITMQPSIYCIEAWFEGVVKGVCKPSIMFKEVNS